MQCGYTLFSSFHWALELLMSTTCKTYMYMHGLTKDNWHNKRMKVIHLFIKLILYKMNLKISKPHQYEALYNKGARTVRRDYARAVLSSLQ